MSTSAPDSGKPGMQIGPAYEGTSLSQVPPEVSDGPDVDDAASDFELTLNPVDDDDDVKLGDATSEFDLNLHDDAFSLMPDIKSGAGSSDVEAKVYRLPRSLPAPPRWPAAESQQTSSSDGLTRSFDPAGMLRRIAIAVNPAGADPAIDVVGDVAVVCARPDVHACIAAALEQLATALHRRPTLMIRACWLNLTEREIASISTGPDLGEACWNRLIDRAGTGGEVTLQASCACADGETAKLVVSADRANPPQPGAQPLGLTLEVTPTLVVDALAETVLLEIKARVRPGSAATQLDTSCRVTIGRPTVIGGLPFVQKIGAVGPGLFWMVIAVEIAAARAGS